MIWRTSFSLMATAPSLPITWTASVCKHPRQHKILVRKHGHPETLLGRSAASTLHVSLWLRRVFVRPHVPTPCVDLLQLGGFACGERDPPGGFAEEPLGYRAVLIAVKFDWSDYGHTFGLRPRCCCALGHGGNVGAVHGT